MMSEGAAFIVRDILESGGPVGRVLDGRGPYRGFAWKTGTSFGFRDAWAVGVSDRYTIGVWVGRPDGTPNPGFFGANVAAPLLTDIFTALPDGLNTAPNPRPAGVTEALICWPLGTRAADADDGTCPMRRTAWLLDGIAPPTFPDRFRTGSPIYSYFVDRVTRNASHRSARVTKSHAWKPRDGPPRSNHGSTPACALKHCLLRGRKTARRLILQAMRSPLPALTTAASFAGRRAKKRPARALKSADRMPK
jgi:penicillin-binding protein 1C